jgi:spindle assembly checkpoint component MAD3
MSTPIIDCDLLEASKQNIQPLASGRSVTALSAVLSTPHAQREAQRQSTKARHRINIQISLNDDDIESNPLEAYTSL